MFCLKIGLSVINKIVIFNKEKWQTYLMDSLYYTQYNDHVSINYNAFEDENSYAYSSSVVDPYISDIDVLIEFNGKNCCQVSNITAIPTVDNNTNINVSTKINNVANIAKYNDINYNESDLNQQFKTKNSLQFSSLAIDTYLTQSNYVFNHITNKIVSIHDNDEKLTVLDEWLLFLQKFQENFSILNSDSYKIPQDICVRCLYNDEYIWRSDESLTHMYNLPMLSIKVMFDSQINVIDVDFVHSYNNFTYNNNEITLYNYDENSQYSASRNYTKKDIQNLIKNEYDKYIQKCIPNISPNKYYYFYLVNLTNEFIHFEDITEYNFYSDAALKQYTLLVFNESMSYKKLLSPDETTQHFIDSWKMKNHKKTVDDIKKIVDKIKEEYNKCSELLLNLLQTNND